MSQHVGGVRRPEPLPVATSLALAGLASVSMALPEWVPAKRVRWPLQLALGVAGGAVVALRPSPVETGTTWQPPQKESAAPADPAGQDGDGEELLPSTAQGLDQPDIRWTTVAPALALGIGLCGASLWIERQLIGWVGRRGVPHPRTALAVALTPLLYLVARHDDTLAG